MVSSQLDEHWMEQAIQLARRGQGWVEPNPMVGCLLVADGECIGQGFHGRFGGPHAEVVAIESATCQERLAGATAYVTLEPCCHHGKTPPCTEALIRANVGRVVISVTDPYPKVAGQGIEQLRSHGIQVDVGLFRQRVEDEILAPYLKRIRTGKPWVIAKWGMTIDGRIATVTRDSKWITSETARSEVHTLRGRMDAVAIGVQTALSDDPLLTARPVGVRTPTRVVYCRHRLPTLESKLFATIDEAPVLLVVSSDISCQVLRPLQDAGVLVLQLSRDGSASIVDTSLIDFGQRGWTNILVEGGSELLASFLAADAIDEVHAYIGAKLLGGSQSLGPIGGTNPEKIAQASEMRLIDVTRFEQDVCLQYRRKASCG
jgi:diaminohydroxyphosphoribosylaminopyrimidine deaminase/5-amino-6-(5-phosphoribosylamino)uracil reductase